MHGTPLTLAAPITAPRVAIHAASFVSSLFKWPRDRTMISDPESTNTMISGYWRGIAMLVLAPPCKSVNMLLGL